MHINIHGVLKLLVGFTLSGLCSNLSSPFFPFDPLFDAKVFDYTDSRAYTLWSLSTRGGYMGTWWEILRYVCIINDPGGAI